MRRHRYLTCAVSSADLLYISPKCCSVQLEQGERLFAL